MINFHGKISLRDYSLWEEMFFPLWFWSCGSNLIWFLFPLSANPYLTHSFTLYFLIKQLLLICDYLFLRKGYLLILIRIPKYFILFYYHICLPQLIWNSFACCKCAPGKRGIVCAQAGPNWVAVEPVSTLLLRILGSNTTGGSPAWFNPKKAHHNILN